MKIKCIEDFSLEDCQKYLNSNPSGEERDLVVARKRAILKQKKYCKELQQRQKRLKQEQIEKDVSWIDINQFLLIHKYRNLLCFKGVVTIIFLFSVYFMLIAFLNYNILNRWCYNDEIGIIVSFLIFPLIIIGIIINLHSSSLRFIYNIEQEEKTKSVRRTQNRAGKFGLHLCKKRRIIQLLPIEYDNIYYCGGNAYQN